MNMAGWCHNISASWSKVFVFFFCLLLPVVLLFLFSIFCFCDKFVECISCIALCLELILKLQKAPGSWGVSLASKICHVE